MNLLAKDTFDGCNNGSLSYRSSKHESHSRNKNQKPRSKHNDRSTEYERKFNSHRGSGPTANLPSSNFSTTNISNSTKIRKVNPTSTQQKEWKMPLSPNRYKRHSEKEIFCSNRLRKQKDATSKDIFYDQNNTIKNVSSNSYRKVTPTNSKRFSARLLEKEFSSVNTTQQKLIPDKLKSNVGGQSSHSRRASPSLLTTKSTNKNVSKNQECSRNQLPQKASASKEVKFINASHEGYIFSHNGSRLNSPKKPIKIGLGGTVVAAATTRRNIEISNKKLNSSTSNAKLLLQTEAETRHRSKKQHKVVSVQDSMDMALKTTSVNQSIRYHVEREEISFDAIDFACDSSQRHDLIDQRRTSLKRRDGTKNAGETSLAKVIGKNTSRVKVVTRRRNSASRYNSILAIELDSVDSVDGNLQGCHLEQSQMSRKPFI